jgi:hypothetical protein
MSKRNRSKRVRWLVLAVVVAAIAAPGAQARLIAPEGNGLAATPGASAAHVRAAESKSGFDWTRAGVLGGVAFALSIVLAAALATRRAPVANS